MKSRHAPRAKTPSVHDRRRVACAGGSDSAGFPALSWQQELQIGHARGARAGSGQGSRLPQLRFHRGRFTASVLVLLELIKPQGSPFLALVLPAVREEKEKEKQLHKHPQVSRAAIPHSNNKPLVPRPVQISPVLHDVTWLRISKV